MNHSVYSALYYVDIYTIELLSTQKVTKQKDTHSAVNRETAKHLGERHFSIAPFLRIEKKSPCLHFTCVRLKLHANDVENVEPTPMPAPISI